MPNLPHFVPQSRHPEPTLVLDAGCSEPACGLSARMRWPEDGPRGQPRATALPVEPFWLCWCKCTSGVAWPSPGANETGTPTGLGFETSHAGGGVNANALAFALVDGKKPDFGVMCYRGHGVRTGATPVPGAQCSPRSW